MCQSRTSLVATNSALQAEDFILFSLQHVKLRPTRVLVRRPPCAEIDYIAIFEHCTYLLTYFTKLPIHELLYLTVLLTSGMSGGNGTSGFSRDVGGLTKLRRRLSAALSHVDFEHCDPPTCISVLQVASIQVEYIENSSAIFILPQYNCKLESPHSRSHRPL